MNDIAITDIPYFNSKLPTEFDGFVIAHLSDIHNKQFGINHGKLIQKLKLTTPDIIVISGDLIDSRRTHPDIAMTLIHAITSIAPVYYVPGNHESRLVEYPSYAALLIDAGVIVLHDSLVEIKIGAASIRLYGVIDPAFDKENNPTDEKAEQKNEAVISDKLFSFNIDTKRVNILLSHRPELIKTYAKYKLDLVFTGHAHGGQFRFPIIGGLYAPSQGIFPKYTSGKYVIDNTTEMVSRGLGDSVIPFRINNRPEIIVCTLYR